MGCWLEPSRGENSAQPGCCAPSVVRPAPLAARPSSSVRGMSVQLRSRHVRSLHFARTSPRTTNHDLDPSPLFFHEPHTEPPNKHRTTPSPPTSPLRLSSTTSTLFDHFDDGLSENAHYMAPDSAPLHPPHSREDLPLGVASSLWANRPEDTALGRGVEPGKISPATMHPPLTFENRRE